MAENISTCITELVGNTPLLELSNYERDNDVQARIVGKVEFFNPLSSVKDRIGVGIIEDAEARGAIEPGATLIEPTSGNTGIALAFVAAAKGYKLILTMPETMSIERRKIVEALGAEVILTPGAEGMAGSIRRADELHEEIAGSFIPGQFVNPANPAVHERTTGEEIWRDTGGKVDVFIAGVGTGGTVTGVARALKKHDPAVHIVAVEPAESAVLSTGKSGPHKIQGIGAGFKPEALDLDVVDEILPIKGDDAIERAREIAKSDGLFVGISAGAAIEAATQIAARPEFAGKTIVTLLPDSGERYLSTELWNEG